MSKVWHSTETAMIWAVDCLLDVLELLTCLVIALVAGLYWILSGGRRL